ncbi:MAG: amino acid adenylation domain-containing protein [Bacteroidales bacterium]|nr:amino acid adenylation domain-containing protein [Bacteroidales bacterium]
MDDKALNIISTQYGKEKRYWMNIFSEKTGFCNFSHLESHKNKDNNLKEMNFKITEDIYNKIMIVTSGSDNRLLVFLMTEVVVLLRKYSQLNDITIGTTILNQEKEGEFINTILPIKNELNGKNTLKELLIKNQFLLKNAIEHSNYPIVNLLRELKIDNNDSNFPLFDVVVFLKNIQNEIFLTNINNNFTFFFERHENYIECNIKYNRNIQTEEDIQQIFKHFERLLNLSLKDPNKNIDKIDILSETEKYQLLYGFNDTASNYPKDKMLHKLFEEQVEKTPNNIALVFEKEGMSFQELNVRSNQLALLLRAKGVKPDTIVGIMVDRSFEMIIGIMGILKAGGAYLPIDLAYPEDRIRYILKDSKAEILLTQESFLKIAEDCKNIFLINLNDKNLYQGNKSNIEITNSISDLIYVIYTSGSTGKPKGTLITHSGVVNYLCWASKIYIKGEKVDFPLYSSLSFDLTVTSLFLPLITGNKVIIYKEKENELVIENVFNDNKVDVVKLTPAHLKLLKENNNVSRIKRLIVGGEELNTDLAKEIHNKYKGNIEIYNEYGPTETVVGCMIYKYNFEKDNNLTVSIGRPVDNVQIYILDKCNMTLPVCIAGELCVGGAGLARGYLGNQILTQEKFIDHPYKEGEKLYRTGDLGKWTKEGNIEFLGRIDHQVKIRGFRIELGEIESTLLKHENIQESVVLAIEESNEKYLCAYVVCKEELNQEELRAYISSQLPYNMIPSYFVELESLPLTPNGKVNRKALPLPEVKAGDDYIAPSNDTEEKLVEIWSELLNIKKEDISITSNFFKIGGHSIKAIIMINQIQKELNIKIPYIQVYKNPTIRMLALIIYTNTVSQGKIEYDEIEI